MKIQLLVTTSGYAPADEEAMAFRKKHHKPGQIVRADIVVPRNRKFHNKLMALFRLAYDQWEPDQTKTYRGHPIEKNYDQFRADITILAGYYNTVWRTNGEMRIQAKSLAVDQMDLEEFETLYSKVVQVLLEQVLNEKGFTSTSIDSLVDQIIQFDR